jgi:exopolysaccharide production protein ExoQ
MENRSTSPSTTSIASVVGFFFAFRLIIVLLSVRILGIEPQTGAVITLGLNLLLPLLVAFQCLGSVEHTFGSMLRLWSIRWAFVFLFFSGISLTWTVAASMTAATAYWCGMAADVLMVMLLLRSGDIPAIAYSLMRGFIWGACAVAVVAWLLPAQSDLRLGDEELLGPNQIGYLCAFALFFVQYLIRKKAGNWTFAAALLGITLLRSLSKTTIGSFIVAEIVLFALDPVMKRKTKVMLIGVTAVAALAFSSLLTSYFETYTASTDPETLTGRLGIWAYILNEAVDKPWIGHGFYSVWKVIPPFGSFEARHAHNELIQQFYAYGVVGIIMMVGIYTSFYLQLRKLPGKADRAFYLALLVFVLIRGITDTEACDISLFLWAIVMFTMLIQCAQRTSVEPVPIAGDTINPNCHPIVIS